MSKISMILYQLIIILCMDIFGETEYCQSKSIVPSRTHAPLSPCHPEFATQTDATHLLRTTTILRLTLPSLPLAFHSHLSSFRRQTPNSSVGTIICSMYSFWMFCQFVQVRNHSVSDSPLCLHPVLFLQKET